jgi:type IV pilus assembly protein PilE
MGPRSAAGLTLIELMIAVAIVGILAAIAYPSYVDYRRRADRSVGIDCMTDIQRRFETGWQRFQRYRVSETGLTFPRTCGEYTVRATGTTETITIRAIPSSKQAKDGELRLVLDRTATTQENRIVKRRIVPGAGDQPW